MRYLLVAFIGLILVTGCQSTAPRVYSDSVSTSDDPMIGMLSKLAGDWEMENEKGEKFLAASFAVTSAGSAVREIMFPGEAHEMTNLYHMDGSELVCTHYCAAGNQPRMIASQKGESDAGTVFHFQFNSVSNLRQSHDHYMGDMTLTILKDGGLRQEWRSFDREGKLTEPVTFMLSRAQ